MVLTTQIHTKTIYILFEKCFSYQWPCDADSGGDKV